MLEHTHFAGMTEDGEALLAWTLPVWLVDALASWEADGAEDDEIDDAAPDTRFFGSGCAA